VGTGRRPAGSGRAGQRAGVGSGLRCRALAGVCRARLAGMPGSAGGDAGLGLRVAGLGWRRVERGRERKRERWRERT
jgi:hypothetical protein